MAQWVKNQTAAARVTAEAWDQSLAWHSGLKDPALLHLWHRSQLWLRFSPWTGNFHMAWVQPLKKKEKEKGKKMGVDCAFSVQLECCPALNTPTLTASK